MKIITRDSYEELTKLLTKLTKAVKKAQFDEEDEELANEAIASIQNILDESHILPIQIDFYLILK